MSLSKEQVEQNEQLKGTKKASFLFFLLKSAPLPLYKALMQKKTPSLAGVFCVTIYRCITLTGMLPMQQSMPEDQQWQLRHRHQDLHRRVVEVAVGNAIRCFQLACIAETQGVVSPVSGEQ